MKNLSNKIYLLISILISFCLFATKNTLASSNIPFVYNILPKETNLSIIDTQTQKKIKFKLYEPVQNIFYNNKEIEIKDNCFEVDISKLSGKTSLTFNNLENESVTFTYFFSDKKGKLDDYELVKGKNLSAYVSTFKHIKIIYSNNEKSSVKRLLTYLKKLPENLLENLSTITMIPYDNVSNIAGVTKENSITLYKFSQYSSTTQKNIIYHEIAHSWANKLMEKQILDYSYTDYSVFVNADNNFVSNYSKEYIKKNNSYSEDFAESVSFYFINKKSFKKKYSERFTYIDSLLNLKTEEIYEE